MFEVARGITAIDTFYGGRERYTAAYLLDADEPAIVETGPTTSFEPVVAGLERLGIGPADLAHIAVTHIHLDHAGGVGRIARALPERDRLGARTRRAAPRRPHAAGRERDVDLRPRDHGHAVRARRTRCGPTDPGARRRRPHRARRPAPRGARHAGPRQASRGARGLLDRAPSSPATRSGSTRPTHARSGRRRRHPTTTSSSRSPRSRASASGPATGSSCSRTSVPSTRSSGSATSRPSASERGPRPSATRSNAVSSRIGTTRSTRSCASCETWLAPTRRPAPRPSSTCRRWRRCPASA